MRDECLGEEIVRERNKNEFHFSSDSNAAEEELFWNFSLSQTVSV